MSTSQIGDADLRASIDALPSIASQPINQIRARTRAVLLSAAGEVQGLESVIDRVIEGDGCGIPVRIYRPSDQSDLPLIVFFHGGGFVVCDLDTHDSIARALAVRSNAVVVSVDYRLAPEFPFPAAYNDSVCAFRWSVEHAREIGADGSRFAVAGDSAGANLATTVARLARDEGLELRMQVLLYPLIDGDLRRHSYRKSPAMADMIKFSVASYNAPSGDTRAFPLAAPDLSGLCPSITVIAGRDVLAAEGIEYAKRMEQSGVDSMVVNFEDAPHGFVGMSAQYPEARQALVVVGGYLATAFTDRDYI